MIQHELHTELLHMATGFGVVYVTLRALYRVHTGELDVLPAAGFLALFAAAVAIAYRHGRTWRERTGWSG